MEIAASETGSERAKVASVAERKPPRAPGTVCHMRMRYRIFGMDHQVGLLSFPLDLTGKRKSRVTYSGLFGIRPASGRNTVGSHLFPFQRYHLSI